MKVIQKYTYVSNEFLILVVTEITKLSTSIACVFVTGSCTVRWENKTMYCIVSVFGLAF